MAFSALASLGVWARSWCWMREPELAEHLVGHVGGRLRHEEDTDPLGADQPHGLGDLVEERLGRVVEEQVRLVEEEHQLRLVEVTLLRQVVEEVREQPHEEGREERRPVLEVGQLEQADDAAPVVGEPQEVLGLELGLAEEHVGALRLEGDQLAQDDTRGLRGESADALELGLALLVTGEELQDRAQVREVEERQPGLVAVVEDQPQRGLLRLVEPEHLGEQRRPEGRHRHSHRYADALAADRVELRREAGRRPRLPHGGGACGELVARARRVG